MNEKFEAIFQIDFPVKFYSTKINTIKMEKKVFLSVALLILSISTVKAQSFLDKIDRAVNKVDNTANTADRASQTSGKVLSIFKKKNKKDTKDDASVLTNKTVFTIDNGNLTSIKNLNSIIENIKGVSSTQMKFNANKSVIVINHSGSTEDLLEKIQAKAQSIFTDKNIQGFDEGNIEIKLK